jgi:hypothetical protein
MEMSRQHGETPKPRAHRLTNAAVMLACFCSSAAYAETSRGFIAPLEYQLPGNLSKPINVVVQYGYVDRSRDQWNATGDKIGAANVDVNAGLTKFVHAWNLESSPNVGVGWEVIAPLVSVQDKTARTTSSGLADPIAGGFAWYKPNKDSTIGTDFLFQVPVGSNTVGGGDHWRIIQSVFGTVQSGGFNYTADVIWDWPGKSTSTSTTAAMTWSTHHRVGYSITPLLLPYIGLDYERQEAKNGQAANYEAVGNLGLMLTFPAGYTFAMHYGRGFRGENRALTNSINARFVYGW